MNSIAIWHDPATENPTKKKKTEAIINNLAPELEVHFNFWKLANTKDHRRFLDIGLKISNPSKVKSLNVFVPFHIDKENVQDLVGKFINTPELVDAIFNESYSISRQSATKRTLVNDSSKKTVFESYQLDTGDYSVQNNIYDGSIIKINIPNSAHKLYLRIRIESDKLDELVVIEEPANAFMQSAFSKIEVLDFRVNEIRALNKSLCENIKGKEIKFGRIHFFFICASGEEVIGSHKPYNNCRNLELNTWSGYIGHEFKEKVNLAYHWKWENPTNISVLVKTKFEKNNWITILKYTALALISGMIVNLSSSYIYEWFHKKSDESKTEIRDVGVQK